MGNGTTAERARVAWAWLGDNIGLICALAMLVFFIRHAFDPPRLNWGDSGSDYNVMTAGRNFQRYGFFALRLTPHLLDPAVMAPDTRFLIYTHYPQLPDLMNGIERVVLRFSQLSEFRLVALAFSFGALAFVYQLVCLYWTRRTAQLALALWVVNPLWIQYADYLHHAPYAFFFGSGTLYLLTRHLRGGGRGSLLGAGVFLFLTFLSSYDFWIFEPVLVAAVVIGHHRSIRGPAARMLVQLAAFGAAALLFKWGTNAWALGGVDGLVRDLRYQVTEHSKDAESFTVIGSNGTATANYRGAMLPTAFGRVARYFSLLLLPIAMLWAAWPLLIRWRSSLKTVVPGPQANPTILLIAGLPFICLFPDLWLVQDYPTLLIVPFYAVACGAMIVLLMNAPVRAVKAAGIALLAALMLNSVDEDVAFKKAFFDPAAIASLRARLDSVAAPGQNILVNHLFDGAYRYYFNHFTVAVIATPPVRMDAMLAYYTDPANSRAATKDGAIFVEHKHLAEEMFDKGYYVVIAHYGLWRLWEYPRAYHAFIDSLVTQRDSELVMHVDRIGQKLYDDPFYAVWRLPPSHSVAGIQ